MKSLFLAIASIAISISSFAQKGKIKPHTLSTTGATITVTVDFSSVGINPASVVFTDLDTGIDYSVSSGNGMIQTLSLPKKTTNWLVMFYMQNNESTEINYWLVWGVSNQGVGITLQPGENRGVGTYDVTVEKDQTFTFVRL